MRGTDGDKPEAGDNMATKETNLHKEPVLYNFDVSQPLIGPVPAKVEKFVSRDSLAMLQSLFTCRCCQ